MTNRSPMRMMIRMIFSATCPNQSLVRTFLMLFCVFSLNTARAQKTRTISINDTITANAQLIYEENFDISFESWQVEQMSGGIVAIKGEKLEITDKSGCTIWFKKALEGATMITYDAHVIDKGGPNDRVSDLNCFWMAKDMEYPDDFFKNSAKRGGKFSNYDSLRLYYMGVGGHDNSKTRFRRYVGDGNRPLLPEHDMTEEKYLIKPNKTTKIKIIAFNDIIQYYRDGERIIDFYDPKPYRSGYFGFRTVNNHMTLDNFKVYSLATNK